MYIDSSAMLAILFDEPDAEALASRLDHATTPNVTSPVSVIETVVRYATKRGVSLAEAQSTVAELLSIIEARTVSITPEIGDEAIRAYATYGKGTGHPASLNLGDVFSYACAKAHDIPLLCKGNDFSHTDLA